MHTCIYKQVYTHENAYIYMHIHMYTYIYSHVYMYIFTYTCTRIYTQSTHVHICVYLSICTHVYMFIDTDTHANTCTCKKTHTSGLRQGIPAFIQQLLGISPFPQGSPLYFIKPGNQLASLYAKKKTAFERIMSAVYMVVIS